jgi:hypothetical protein
VGIEPECTANWEVEMQVILEAAEANRAVFVSFFDVFTGPEHDEDPRGKGWMQDDGTPSGPARRRSTRFFNLYLTSPYCIDSRSGISHTASHMSATATFIIID